MLEAVKNALQLSTTTKYDSELTDYIHAGLLDLTVTAGVTNATTTDTTDPLIQRAVVTYACAQFYLTRDSSQYAVMMAAYESQKGSLRQATGYTNWGNDA